MMIDNYSKDEEEYCNSFSPSVNHIISRVKFQPSITITNSLSQKFKNITDCIIKFIHDDVIVNSSLYRIIYQSNEMKLPITPPIMPIPDIIIFIEHSEERSLTTVDDYKEYNNVCHYFDNLELTTTEFEILLNDVLPFSWTYQAMMGKYLDM